MNCHCGTNWLIFVFNGSTGRGPGRDSIHDLSGADCVAIIHKDASKQ